MTRVSQRHLNSVAPELDEIVSGDDFDVGDRVIVGGDKVGFAVAVMLHILAFALALWVAKFSSSPFSCPHCFFSCLLSSRKLGIVRYRGPTDFRDGDWVGVQLDEAAGKNNGTVNGVEYFRAKPKCVSRLWDFSQSSSVSLILSVPVFYSPPLPCAATASLCHHIVCDWSARARPRLPARRRPGDRRAVAWARPQHPRPLSARPGLERGPMVPSARRRAAFRALAQVLPAAHRPRARQQAGALSLPLRFACDTVVISLDAPSRPPLTPPPPAPAPLLQPDMFGVGSRAMANGVIGTVRFIGETEFAEGLWIGLELGEPMGKNNGSVQGVQYFRCHHNCGIFVRPNRVTWRGLNAADLC